jgi:PII-like signaling protein
LLTTGPAKKVAVYVMEGEQHHGMPVYSAILEYLFYRGISDATVTRGIAGFGADHKIYTSRLVDLSDRMPIKVEFIESAEKVNEVLPKLADMVGTGFFEIQETSIVTLTSVDRANAAEPPTIKREGKAKLMRILIGENDKWNGKPLHEALMESLRANDIAGVTVYRGILGYGANRRIHKDAALSLSHDAPILLSVVETEEKLRAYFPVLDKMVHQGLVVMSDVEIIKYTHDYAKEERRKEERP